jgi:hypothetical protein
MGGSKDRSVQARHRASAAPGGESGSAGSGSPSPSAATCFRCTTPEKCEAEEKCAIGAAELAESLGPYLIIAAFWQEDDNTDAVAEAVKQEAFPRPPGYSAGAVVAFRHEVADSLGFRRDLGRFDLEELNERPE